MEAAKGRTRTGKTSKWKGMTHTGDPSNGNAARCLDVTGAHIFICLRTLESSPCDTSTRLAVCGGNGYVYDRLTTLSIAHFPI